MFLLVLLGVRGRAICARGGIIVHDQNRSWPQVLEDRLSDKQEALLEKELMLEEVISLTSRPPSVELKPYRFRKRWVCFRLIARDNDGDALHSQVSPLGVLWRRGHPSLEEEL